MRILHITPHYAPDVGGAETYTKEISERLARRGHDVTVLTTRPPGVADEPARAMPVPRTINDVRLERFTPTGKLDAAFRMALSTQTMAALLGPIVHKDTIRMWAENPYGVDALRLSVRSNPDVVAVINWYGGCLAHQAGLARRIRRFALIGIPLFHTESRWSQASLYAELLEQCTAVVALTQHEKTFIEQRSRSRTSVIGAGIDPAAFADADGSRIRARYGIGDAPLVGYVGRMVPSKGVATLIRAMKSVWEREPRAYLLLAGGGLPAESPSPGEIAQTLASLSAAERSRVVVTGPFNDADKASLYDALDVFAMASSAESFGIAYLEAWMCRKPVIGLGTGSTRCVIDDERDGVLVAPENPGALADAVIRLLSDRVTAQRMGRVGHAKTMAHFTWDRIADRVEHVYGEALAAACGQQSANRTRGRRALWRTKVHGS